VKIENDVVLIWYWF